MFGIGFYSVFLVQSHLLAQIVLGAPIFEEMLKFGLALLLVAYLPAGSGVGRVGVVALRVVAAAAVGAGFGFLEHSLPAYSSESGLFLLWRVLFHGGSTLLSMLAFCGLESLADVRVRWLAVGPAVLLHYANNAGAVIWASLAGFAPSIERVAEAWNPVILAGMAVAVVLAFAWPKGVRALGQRVAAKRFPPMPAPRAPPSTPAPPRAP